MQIQHYKTQENWAQWALRTVMNAGIIPIHSRHIARSLKTVKIVIENINEEYVKKGVQQFNVITFFKTLTSKDDDKEKREYTPGLTSVIGCIRLLACSGVFSLTENGVSFTESTAKSISCVTIKTPENYEFRNIPIQVTCINTFCMFAVEHPDKLLPKLQKEIPFETLIPFCATEPIDIDTISTANLTFKVICKLCVKLMEIGYSLGFSVRCKDATSRYGAKFRNKLSKLAIECGTQLKIEPKEEKIIEVRKPTKRFIAPITSA